MIFCKPVSFEYNNIYRRFIESHFESLKKDFEIKWRKPPGYTTLRNILMEVDRIELESCFRAYTQSLLAENKTDKLIGIAMDGKVLRGSFDHFKDKRATQIVSMFETDGKIILAHEVIDEKTNEIPVIQALLTDLELEGYCYTMDALHCQKKTFDAAQKANKSLMVQLKDNQKELVNNCMDIVQLSKPLEEYTKENAGRNRIEKRTIKTYKDNMFIVDKQWQNSIKRIYSVKRSIQKLNTKTKQYQTANEHSFYLSNKEFSAKQAYELIRNHWLIENSNHYVRDVSMQEDFSRIRINPDNMARIRSFALNIMRKNNVQNIKGEMYENSLCFSKLYSYKHFI